MDLQSAQQPISDDQELAKVLAGVTEEADESEAAGAGSLPGVPTPTTPMPTAPVPAPDPAPVAAEPAAAPVAPVVDPAELEAASAEEATPAPAVDGALDSVKQEAIGELRPLVDKLNVSPEEKFDTYLLLIRSTDDKSLIAPAHEAAKSIQDEAKRADALLNIIKEIDYLSSPSQ